MVAKQTWVLVANSTFARLYRVIKTGLLDEIEIFEHPQGRLKEQDLCSDKPGRAFESIGTSRSAMEVKTPMKKQEFIDFARVIAARLESERDKGTYSRLFLAASPEFLGLLRKELSPGTVHLVSGEVAKDMTQLKANEVVKHFELLS